MVRQPIAPGRIWVNTDEFYSVLRTPQRVVLCCALRDANDVLRCHGVHDTEFSDAMAEVQCVVRHGAAIIYVSDFVLTSCQDFVNLALYLASSVVCVESGEFRRVFAVSDARLFASSAAKVFVSKFFEPVDHFMDTVAAHRFAIEAVSIGGPGRSEICEGGVEGTFRAALGHVNEMQGMSFVEYQELAFGVPMPATKHAADDCDDPAAKRCAERC